MLSKKQSSEKEETLFSLGEIRLQEAFGISLEGQVSFLQCSGSEVKRVKYRGPGKGRRELKHKTCLTRQDVIIIVKRHSDSLAIPLAGYNSDSYIG